MYTQLAHWHRKYGDRIVLMLFPSDEFGGQELPAPQIPDFVKGRGLPLRGMGCHLMSKVHVNGPDAHPIWKHAKQAFPGEVGWNFDGIFLFDASGFPKGRYTAGQLVEVDDALKSLVLHAKDEF